MLPLDTTQKLNTTDYPKLGRRIGTVASSPIQGHHDGTLIEVTTEKPCLWHGGTKEAVSIDEKKGHIRSLLTQNIESISEKIAEISIHAEIQQKAKDAIDASCDTPDTTELSAKFGVWAKDVPSAQLSVVRNFNPTLNTQSSVSWVKLEEAGPRVHQSINSAALQCRKLVNVLESAKSLQEEAVRLIDTGGDLELAISKSQFELTRPTE